jgi:tellurite resistance protein TerC
VLLFGIAFALVLRTIFIFAGAAAIENFSWIFYVFGGFLIYTAWAQARSGGHDEEEEFKENSLLRLTRRVLPTADDYHGDRLTTKVRGKRYITPLFIALIAIGSADILFAVDSIPAIFGLTQETYLVFTANAFALLGLRQLFFLLDGLLDRLVYLAYGLAVILGFIGVKLVIHALHTNELPFINGGEHVTAVPEIPTWLSLAVIVVTLLVTTWASLRKNRRDAAAGRPSPTGPADAGAGAEGREVAAPHAHDDLPTGGRGDALPTGRTAAVRATDGSAEEGRR